jgi:hypothetical protein
LTRETPELGVDALINMRAKKIKTNQHKYRRMAVQPISRVEYVNSEDLLLSSQEVEKLDLLYQLYEREQKGVNFQEKDEEAVKSRIYGRLGELLGVSPNLKFMGEMEHGSPL